MKITRKGYLGDKDWESLTPKPLSDPDISEAIQRFNEVGSIKVKAGTRIIVCDVDYDESQDKDVLLPREIIDFEQDGEVITPEVEASDLTTDQYLFANEGSEYHCFGGEPVDITNEILNKTEWRDWRKEDVDKIKALNPTYVLYQM